LSRKRKFPARSRHPMNFCKPLPLKYLLVIRRAALCGAGASRMLARAPGHDDAPGLDDLIALLT
jgi:hypothetical protein